MSGVVEIPKMGEEYHHRANEPAWIQFTENGALSKPVIRCNCGRWCGIGLHHVHADGRVTASFYYSRGTNFAIGQDPEGCGWHVFIKLLDYNGGEFLPSGGKH